jgi:hypothetical protein
MPPKKRAAAAASKKPAAKKSVRYKPARRAAPTRATAHPFWFRGGRQCPARIIGTCS